MSPPTRESAPNGSAPHGPSRQAGPTRKTTRRWTDVAPNDPPVDHQDPAYIAAVDAAVERGELEEVDR